MQSEMSLKAPNDLALRYTQKMMAFLLFQPRPMRIVLIGLGGGSLVKFCHHRLPGARMTAVELDPDVIAWRDTFSAAARRPAPADPAGRRRRLSGAGRKRHRCAARQRLRPDRLRPQSRQSRILRKRLRQARRQRRPGHQSGWRKESYAGLIGAAMHVFDDQVIVISVPEDGNHVLYAFKER